MEAFDPQKHGPGLLVEAIVEGSRTDLERLIAFGADVSGLSQRGEYPLSVAAEWGRLDAARMLLDAGADPNRKDGEGKTPLDYARRRKDSSAMRSLLASRGAK
jgi:ankyrin repeat protein